MTRSACILVVALTACADAANHDTDATGESEAEGSDGQETETETAAEAETAAGDPPELAILFPPGGGTVASSIHVRVAAIHPSGVDAVQIGDVEASPIEGTTQWMAEIPLELGSNTIVITAAADGAEHVIDFTLLRWATLADVEIGSGEQPGAIFSGVDVSSDGRWAFYGNNFHDDLARVDLLASVREGVSGDTSGGGPPGLDLEGPREPLLDELAGLAYVLDPGRSRVAVVDVAAGTWQVLADVTTGAGGPIAYPNDIELDPVLGRLVVLDRGVNGLLALDPVSGDRTILSGAGTGSGDELLLPMSVALDLDAGQAYVTEQYSSRLRRIDLATGDRSLVFEADQPGEGPAVEDFDELAWEPESGRLITWSPSSRGLFAIDPTTANRTLLSSDTLGTGATIEHLLALDHGPGWTLLADERESAMQVWLHAVDGVSGDRVVLHVMESLTE